METGSLLRERYRLQAEIGRGGMAVVYRAHDQLLERDVAIKVIRRTDLADQDRERLLHEARLAGRLNHPNIVAVHDAGQVDGSPFVVMELVDGRSLYDSKPSGLEDIIAVTGQLCRALAHAHEMGIVHRDLKPENILRAADGMVKLTDFGLALSVASRISRDGILVGTVYYLAPEQVQGQRLDGRADLYALGVLLYEWTTGAPPFTADDALAVITQHLYAPVIPPRARNLTLPPQLDRLIVQLLSKAPDDRPASAGEVLHTLESPGFLETPAAAEVPVLERIGRGRLAGRGAELSEARRLWGQVLGGGSRTLLIRGEAGIGKTRLARELMAQAEASRARVLQGWNIPQPAQPFGAIRQMLRTAFDEMPDAVARCPEFVVADLLTLAPEYHRRFPDLPLGASIGSASEQERLFESMAVLLATLSQEAPVLVVVEDAQWADSGTLTMLRYLAQQTRQRRILFLWTLRDVEPAEAPTLHEVLLDFRRDQVALSIRLERLDRRSSEAMLQALFDGPVASEVVDEVHRVTDGNPFFIEEVCKGLAESGRLKQAEGRWQLTGRKEFSVPENVRIAVKSRVQAMPAATQQALEVAAVRGAEFELEVICRAGDLDEAAAADALEAAERAEIVREISEASTSLSAGSGGRRFTFTHSLIPASLVGDLPGAAKRILHGRIGGALERLSPDEFETLAYHYSAAGDRDKAVYFLMQAGDRAQALCACPEAVESYSAALELQRATNRTEETARTLLKLGLVYSADFRFDKAQEAYEQAFALWEDLRAAETPPVEPGSPITLRYAMAEPLSLDPGLAGDDASTFVIGQLMEGLLEIDEAWGVIPALARSWDVSDDGRRYTFHLRRGWTWSDGHPLTAADFEYAWKRNLALASDSPAGLLLYIIENARLFAEGTVDADRVGVRAVQPLTLEIRLAQPASYFPQLLTHPVTFPLPRWVVEGAAQPWTDPENFVGNGPYRMEEWTKGRRMVFVQNSRYRGLRRGNAQRIEAPVVVAYPPLLAAFEAGGLDGISLLQADPGTTSEIQATYRRRFSANPVLSTFFLAFHTGRAPFDAPAVRKALIHAVDREALLRASGRARYRVAMGGFLPPGMPGHSPVIGLGHDPERARLLLSEAGYDGGDGFPEVELLYSGDPNRNPLAEFLARVWEDELGVRVRPVGVDWAEFMRRRDHDPAAISVSGWSADYPDPDNMLRLLFHSREGVNAIRWSHAEFDTLTGRAASTTDRKARIALYQQADRILVADEAAVMPLGYVLGAQLVQPYVQVPHTPPSRLLLKHVVVNRPQV